MKYIISGCTGCIGVSLIKKLGFEENQLTVILNPGSKRNTVIESNNDLLIFYEKLGKYANIDLQEKQDVFIHMAWDGGLSRDDFEKNQLSSFATIDALTLAHRLGCQKFISIGSQAEYGISNQVITEKLECLPESEFGIAKLNTYFRLRSKARALGIEMTWLRVLSAYGPFDRRSSMLMSTIDKLLKGADISLSDCEHKWDFLHSDDIADAIISLSTTMMTRDLYVIGSDDNFILKDYIRELIKGFDVKEREIFGKFNNGYQNLVNLQSDSTLLRTDIGWEPKISFSKGIKDLILHEREKRNMLT